MMIFYYERNLDFHVAREKKVYRKLFLKANKKRIEQHISNKKGFALAINAHSPSYTFQLFGLTLPARQRNF